MYTQRDRCCPQCMSYLSWDGRAHSWFCGACNDYPYGGRPVTIDEKRKVVEKVIELLREETPGPEEGAEILMNVLANIWIERRPDNADEDGAMAWEFSQQLLSVLFTFREMLKGGGHVNN
jgi:hypothetical protein